MQDNTIHTIFSEITCDCNLVKCYIILYNTIQILSVSCNIIQYHVIPNNAIEHTKYPAIQQNTQMCTFTFTFLKACKVIIDFQYFTNNILSQFQWRFPILHKPFFLFGTESTMWLRKLRGWLVGFWDGTNLGSIPIGTFYPNSIPKSQ